MTKSKVMVATPVMEQVSSEFHTCLVNLAIHQALQMSRGGPTFAIATRQSSSLPDKRQTLADMAIKHGFTHVLWIDSDMTFPKDLLERLLRWGKPIVGCACPTKSIPTQVTACMVRGPNEFEPISIEEPGLVAVDRVGHGILLVETEVYKRLTYPWYNMEWREERLTYEGEDWYFLRKAQANGYEAFVDKETSSAIGHAGSFVFTHGLGWGEEGDQGNDSHAESRDGNDAVPPGDDGSRGLHPANQPERYKHHASQRDGDGVVALRAAGEASARGAGR